MKRGVSFERKRGEEARTWGVSTRKRGFGKIRSREEGVMIVVDGWTADEGLGPGLGATRQGQGLQRFRQAFQPQYRGLREWPQQTVR